MLGHGQHHPAHLHVGPDRERALGRRARGAGGAGGRRRQEHRGRPPRQTGVLGRRDSQRRSARSCSRSAIRSTRPSTAPSGWSRADTRRTSTSTGSASSAASSSSTSTSRTGRSTWPRRPWDVDGPAQGGGGRSDRPGPAGEHEVHPVQSTCTSRTALAGRPEFYQLREGIEARRRLVEVERKQRLPALLRRHPGRPRVRDQSGPAREPVRHRSPVPHRRRPVIGFKYSLDFGIRAGKVKEAEAEVQKLEALRDHALDGIPLQVRDAYITVVEAERNAKVLDEAFENAKQWLVASSSNVGPRSRGPGRPGGRLRPVRADARRLPPGRFRLRLRSRAARPRGGSGRRRGSAAGAAQAVRDLHPEDPSTCDGSWFRSSPSPVALVGRASRPTPARRPTSSREASTGCWPSCRTPRSSNPARPTSGARRSARSPERDLRLAGDRASARWPGTGRRAHRRSARSSRSSSPTSWSGRTSGKIEAYSGEKIVYGEETVDGDQATVRTKLVTKTGTQIPIDYQMQKIERSLARLRREDRERGPGRQLPVPVQPDHPAVGIQRPRAAPQDEAGGAPVRRAAPRRRPRSRDRASSSPRAWASASLP